MGSMQLPPVVLCLPVPTLFSGGDGGNCYKLINIVSQICDNCLFPFTLWGVNMCSPEVISNFPHLFFLTCPSTNGVAQRKRWQTYLILAQGGTFMNILFILWVGR